MFLVAERLPEAARIVGDVRRLSRLDGERS
jgi:hypothetical protein